MGQFIYGDAIHTREQAKIDAARVTQKSGNERRGAETALQIFSASLANKRVMDAAGHAVGDISVNVAHNLDAASFGSFMGRVQAAEELGASTAAAAAAGVGGSSVELYNHTLRLNQAMREEQQNRAVSSDNWAAGQQRGAVITDAVASLDNNVYRANLDYTQYVDHKKMGTLDKIVGIGATAAATYFGGPQAGAAVANLFESDIAARNGDFGQASQSLMASITGGIKAYQDYRKIGGDYWSSAKPQTAGTDHWDSVNNIMNSVRLR